MSSIDVELEVTVIYPRTDAVETAEGICAELESSKRLSSNIQ